MSAAYRVRLQTVAARHLWDGRKSRGAGGSSRVSGTPDRRRHPAPGERWRRAWQRSTLPWRRSNVHWPAGGMVSRCSCRNPSNPVCGDGSRPVVAGIEVNSRPRTGNASARDADRHLRRGVRGNVVRIRNRPDCRSLQRAPRVNRGAGTADPNGVGPGLLRCEIQVTWPRAEYRCLTCHRGNATSSAKREPRWAAHRASDRDGSPTRRDRRASGQACWRGGSWTGELDRYCINNHIRRAELGEARRERQMPVRRGCCVPLPGLRRTLDRGL